MLDVFQRNCLQIVLGTQMTEHISNSRLYKKFGSILLSRVIMKERLRWLGHVLRMRDDRLPKIVLFGQPSRAKRKAGRPRLGWEDVIKKDLKEMGTSWKDIKRESLNRLGWRRNIIILEATVMTVVKYGSEAWVLLKADEDLLDVF